MIRKAVRMVESNPLDVVDVLEKVCGHYGVETSVVNSKARKREIVQVRQVAMYLAKKHTEASLAKIGTLVGKRDHATVLHACKTIGAQLEVDKVFRSEIEEIENELRKR